MRQPVRSIVQVILLMVVVGVLIRFFPWVARIGEAAALGLREFWWGILIVALAVWLVWTFRKRH